MTHLSLFTFPTCSAEKEIYKILLQKSVFLQKEIRTERETERRLKALLFVSPVVPMLPFSPLMPGSPTGPGSPLGPVSPFSPGNPATQKTVRREIFDIQKVIFAAFDNLLYLECPSLQAALVAPSLPWALRGLSPVGSTHTC